MRFDLHIHSCLSPCADLEMSPTAIVAAVKDAGLDAFAITDHQTARNAPALVECARRAGLKALPGMEVCTAEEVHNLCIFDTCEQAAAMTEWVYAALPKRVNDPDTFGDQPVVTADEEIVEMEWRILAAACRRTIPETAAKCHELGGLFIAAHVDRATFSVISQLGAIPEPNPYDALELSRLASPPAENDGFAYVRSSDAHVLADVARVHTSAPLAAFSVAALKEAFRNRTTRPSAPLAHF